MFGSTFSSIVGMLECMTLYLCDIVLLVRSGVSVRVAPGGRHGRQWRHAALARCMLSGMHLRPPGPSPSITLHHLGTQGLTTFHHLGRHRTPPGHGPYCSTTRARDPISHLPCHTVECSCGTRRTWPTWCAGVAGDFQDVCESARAFRHLVLCFY